MKQISLVKEIQDDAIRFGNEANLSRAIPYIRDGLKPSQRYTIYTALSHGYTSNKPHIKSLKLDGQVVGEAWPHGSEYQTIVRLTQDFVQNVPLLEMHGANGSQLGTPDAAASRYTEVRLSKACEDGLLANIKKDTVDWRLNYSEDLELPVLLPALLPTLYVNGSDGVAYCYSQTWLPGNLNEFTQQVKNYLQNKKINYEEIAFDFPTKGIIINKKDLPEIYKTGKGAVVLRGKAEIIDSKTIKITELPYQVYVTEYLQQLKSLIISNKIPEISNIFNLSGDAGMNIEIECSADPEIVLQKLYKYSNLQVNLIVNQYGIIDSIPELINLEEYIKVYVDHNIKCIQREYKFDLDKAQSRLEIVTGLIRAISIIDEIILTIKKSKSSEDAKQMLINQFSFTENQAKSIVDMRLGKLSSLEQNELNVEKSDLDKTIDACNKVLGSTKLQEKEFLKRLCEFTAKYGWQRRTKVEDISILEENENIKKQKVSISEECIIVLTKGNYLKKIKLANYKTQTKVNNESDRIISEIKVDTKAKFILLSASGKMYKFQANKLDFCSLNSVGTSLDDLLNDKIISIYSGNEEASFIVFITKNAQIKKMNIKDVFGISKNIGTTVMKLEALDEILDIRLVKEDDTIILKNGKREKQIDVSKLTAKGRIAGGICGIKLNPKYEFEIL